MGFDSSWSIENVRFNWISRVFTSWQVLSDFRQSQQQLLKCYTSERQLLDEDKMEHKRSDKPRCCAAPPVRSAGELWSCRPSLSQTPTPRPQPPGPETDGASSDVLTWIMSVCVQWCTDMDHVSLRPVMYWHGSCQRASSDVLRWNMSTCIQRCTDMEGVNMHPMMYRHWSINQQHTKMEHVNTHPVTYWHGSYQHASCDILTQMMSTRVQWHTEMVHVNATHAQWCTDMDVNIHPAMLCT